MDKKKTPVSHRPTGVIVLLSLELVVQTERINASGNNLVGDDVRAFVVLLERSIVPVVCLRIHAEAFGKAGN